MMKKFTASLLLFVILVLSGCQEDPANCDEAICYLSIELVTVQVLDQNGMTVSVDSTKTVTASGELIFANYGPFDTEEGYVLILNGTHREQLSDYQNIVILQGWKDGDQVIDQQFLVRKDCCSVLKEDGPELIQIDL
ncbi:MAG: hypothetical protein AAFO69_16090 [Bacteroidota bacterium]